MGQSTDTRSTYEKGIEAFRELRKMAENHQLPELTLDEINEEIRLAREEMDAKKKRL